LIGGKSFTILGVKRGLGEGKWIKGGHKGKKGRLAPHNHEKQEGRTVHNSQWLANTRKCTTIGQAPLLGDRGKQIKRRTLDVNEASFYRERKGHSINALSLSHKHTHPTDIPF
jgi:hypothetical protein